MSGSENGKSLEGTKEEKFLAAEYQALITLDAARNTKLDGFLTLYMTLAAAPWALYALTFKDHAGVPTISTIPSLVALSFILTGILGALVAMMYIQVWFNIVLYMRSVNAIRGYFLEKGTKLTFHLPISSEVPPYYAKGSYIQFAVNGMALVNSGYVLLGVFNLVQGIGSPALRYVGVLLLFLFCMIAHRMYYRSQADARDVRSRGPHLRWQK
ncbi:MAG: hypothetical protein WBX38_21070 [Candidatus Sulfotelmatobacter sp.]